MLPFIPRPSLLHTNGSITRKINMFNTEAVTAIAASAATGTVFSSKVIMKNKYSSTRRLLSSSSSSSSSPMGETETSTSHNVKSFESIPKLKNQIPYVGPIEVLTQLKTLPVVQEKWRHEYGDIVRFKLFGRDNIMLYDADDFATAFRTNPTRQERPILDFMRQYKEKHNLPLSLTHMYMYEDWKSQRSVMNVLMRPQYVSKLLERVSNVSLSTVDRIDRDLSNSNTSNEKNSNILTPTQIYDILQDYVLEAFAAIVYGKDLQLNTPQRPPEGDHFLKVTIDFFDCVLKLMFSPPFHKIFSTPTMRKFERSFEAMLKLSEKLIAQDGIGKHIDDGNQSIAEAMQKQAELNGDPSLTPEVLNIILLEILGAGVDTTLHTVVKLLYVLAYHQDVQQKLFEEVDAVLGAEHLRPMIDAERMKQLKYLKNTCSEVLRMYPMTPMHMRTFDEDIMIRGYHIPKGTTVNMSNYSTSLDSRFFENPTQFRPERFREKEGHPFASLTFGFGPRMCVGSRVALTELHTLIARIVHRYKISCSSPTLPRQEQRLLYQFMLEDEHMLKLEKR